MDFTPACSGPRPKSCLVQDKIDHPAPTHVRAAAPAVAQEVVGVAPRIHQSVRQHGHPVERPIFVDATGHPRPHRARPPALSPVKDRDALDLSAQVAVQVSERPGRVKEKMRQGFAHTDPAGRPWSGQAAPAGGSPSRAYTMTPPQHRGHPPCTYPARSAADRYSTRSHVPHRTSGRGIAGGPPRSRGRARRSPAGSERMSMPPKRCNAWADRPARAGLHARGTAGRHRAYFFLPAVGRPFAFTIFFRRCGNFVAGRRVDRLGPRAMSHLRRRARNRSPRLGHPSDSVGRSSDVDRPTRPEKRCRLSRGANRGPRDASVPHPVRDEDRAGRESRQPSPIQSQGKPPDQPRMKVAGESAAASENRRVSRRRRARPGRRRPGPATRAERLWRSAAWPRLPCRGPVARPHPRS